MEAGLWRVVSAGLVVKTSFNEVLRPQIIQWACQVSFAVLG